MKKLFAVLLLLTMLFISSCSEAPADTSSDMYQIGINSLNVADRYIKGEITGKESADHLHEYMEQADTQYKKECADFGEKTLVNTKYKNDYSINHHISMLYFAVSSSSRSGTAMSEVKEKRDNLASVLGK